MITFNQIKFFGDCNIPSSVTYFQKEKYMLTECFFVIALYLVLIGWCLDLMSQKLILLSDTYKKREKIDKI